MNDVETQVQPKASVTIVRLLDAPVATVWRAWTDPKQLAQWWGPRDFTNPVCEVDLRPGGAMTIVMRGPDGTAYPMTATYLEVVANERLAFSMAAVSPEGVTHLEGVTVVTFEDHGDKTKLTVQAKASGLTPQSVQMLAGMQAGWDQSVERLVALLAGT